MCLLRNSQRKREKIEKEDEVEKYWNKQGKKNYENNVKMLNSKKLWKGKKT